MGWLVSLAVALLTSLVSMVVSGFVADSAVRWYRISSFEGGSGYFVIGMALLGLMGGFVIGLIAARVVAAMPKPGFVKAMGTALGVVAVVIGLIGGWARLLADVPPEMDGEQLLLLVELRWPAAGEAAPQALPGIGKVMLGASSGRTVRVQRDGVLLVEDARQEDGRWIVPGAVSIFTSRGDRLLDFTIGEKTLGGFIAPLPGHPGDESREWSAWMPHAAPGAPALPDGFTYRYRVVRHSEPMRKETIGPFEIDTHSSGFFNVASSDRFASYSTFAIRYRGQPVAGLDVADGVAVLSGEPTALLVHPEQSGRAGPCVLVIDTGQGTATRTLGNCMSPIEGHPVTSDPARFRRAVDRDVVRGWVDRQTFAEPGLYWIDQFLLDTRDRTAAPFLAESDPSPHPSVPPLGLSPDERSVVWFTHNPSEDKPVLGVTDRTSGRSYLLPIDRSRMRFNRFEAIDPAWVAHHFQWQANGEGVDVLAGRPDIVPLPYRGDLTLGKPGEYQSYVLQPGAGPLGEAVLSLLVSELGGTRLADAPDAYQQRVQIDGKEVHVAVDDSTGYVAVSMDSGAADPALMTRIAERLDAVMATGRYDELFRMPNSPDESK